MLVSVSIVAEELGVRVAAKQAVSILQRPLHSRRHYAMPHLVQQLDERAITLAKYAAQYMHIVTVWKEALPR